MASKRKHSVTKENETKKIKTNSQWPGGLLNSMEDPELLVRSDDRVVVIKDKYPKAEYHYLVIPKENISNLKAVKDSHLELLKHMHSVGTEIAGEPKHKGKTFKLGYHAEASMIRLHLHVISDDMNSACLKTKKHWNSFTSEFFLDSKEICKVLETDGKIKLLSSDTCKKLMNLPLKCHKCDYLPNNMPDLKKHILKHI